MKDFICKKCGKHYGMDDLFWEKDGQARIVPAPFGLTHHMQGFFLCCGLKQIVAGKGDLPGTEHEEPSDEWKKRHTLQPFKLTETV